MNVPRRLMSAGFRTPLALTALTLLAAAPVAAQNAPAPPPVTVGGVVYSQYEYWPSDSLNHTSQFDLQRAYLNAIGRFGPKILTRITADIFRPGAAPSLDYRIKYAYFQWRPDTAGPVDFRFGVTQTPWLDWEESLYGFRMQGTMPMERAGFLTSADLGVALDFFTPHSNVLNGSIGIYNGEGYGNPPGGKFMDYEARASVRLLPSNDNSAQGGLRLTGYGHVGRLDAFGGPPRDRWIAEASYKSKLGTLAGEAGWATSGLAPTTANPNPANVKGRVLAAFGVLNIPNSAVQLLLRVDHFNPNTAVSDTSNTRFIGGVAYRISPNVRVLGDIDAVSYEQTSPLAAPLQAQKTKLLFQTEFTF